MAARTRANGEGSIYPYRNGFAAYAWVTKPDGRRARKYVYGPDRATVHEKWIALHAKAKEGPVATKVPTLGAYLTYWISEVVAPNLAPATVVNYDMFVRLYIVPGLGAMRLDKLTVRDVRTWHNRLRQACQCCVQGKDAARPANRRRCCAVGKCCRSAVSERTARDAWTVLRNALNNAIVEELLTRNPAGLVKVAKPRARKPTAWTADEAKTFLEGARAASDPFYAAYVLILVCGLRRGEVLGLRWVDVDQDQGQLSIAYQLQRVGGQLLHRETKTESSDSVLPLPDICSTALESRRERQQQDRRSADMWHDTGLVFTTRHGTPIEPRNFHREFKTRCARAGVRQIAVHTTRRTCATLLVALDVHPRVAMQILRHSQISVTMNEYSQVPSAETRKALKRLGKRLGG
jgi:integrase